MTSKHHQGFIKTFSAGLGSGSVEAKVGGKTISLPFSSSVVNGPKRQLRSGDRVLVKLGTAKGKPHVTAIEFAPAKPETDVSATQANGERDSSRGGEETVLVPVSPGEEINARFTKDNFLKYGSRLDFS